MRTVQELLQQRMGAEAATGEARRSAAALRTQVYSGLAASSTRLIAVAALRTSVGNGQHDSVCEIASLLRVRLPSRCVLPE